MELNAKSQQLLRACRTAGSTYTVIEKSGCKGIEVADARLAAQAYYDAPVEGRPFVLCNFSHSSCVIADTRRVSRCGRLVKHVIVTCDDGGAFMRCFDQLVHERFRLLARLSDETHGIR
ncbi:hypothetical protein [Janthinobacterium sp. SUN137]|uniref:hypothetical protein n=1 Tax=Janthinobacterium sp. SUN137 TaxID=3014789 RepID=UPI002712955A|nr:hypothetical protein [Janthinobacterium sp. SUN137]MDO8040296.1 hypothetical protein [Janthinobacterium sp. SUN137]